jgi:hypothetical protein
MKDNFSRQSSLYAQYRPTYPPALFEYITGFVSNKNTAWDCGTGNGQCAAALSKYFKKVIATDISIQQIENAEMAPNIFYSVHPAEQTGIKAGSIDLVTVAQALHWFDLEQFYKEVIRVANQKALFAAWCYSLLHISEPIDAAINNFHYYLLGAYWDDERKFVDEEYKTIPFPFEKIDTPSFSIETNWSLNELEGYFNTWSGLQKYISVHHVNPVTDLIHAITPLWGEKEKRKIIFPIHLLLGVIK